MNSSSSSLFILAAVIFLQCLSATGAAWCHPDDEAGLLAFKSGITGDRLGILNLSQWKKGTECCYWMGVICNPGDRVTTLRISGSTVLGESTISGTISPSLAKLQHLEEVYFTYLRNITGSFPEFILQLPKLKHVEFRGTGLSGPLPTNIGALSQLDYLSLDDNRFTGSIPTSIYNSPKLTWLSLRGNRISGTIPDIFRSMTKLVILDLSSNQFSGKLPSSFASLAPSLTYLNLSQNNLSGTIPNYLSRFEALSSLYLSHNLLSGPIPELKIVYYLDLSYNQFHLKTIPKWVTSSPSIFTLKLAKCGIKMRLDDWKPEGTKIFNYIDLSENEFSGSPKWFLNQAESLVEFQASGNKLGFDMGKLKFAKSLSIGSVKELGIWQGASNGGWTGKTELKSKPSWRKASGDKVPGQRFRR